MGVWEWWMKWKGEKRPLYQTTRAGSSSPRRKQIFPQNKGHSEWSTVKTVYWLFQVPLAMVWVLISCWMAARSVLLLYFGDVLEPIVQIWRFQNTQVLEIWRIWTHSVNKNPYFWILPQPKDLSSLPLFLFRRVDLVGTQWVSHKWKKRNLAHASFVYGKALGCGLYWNQAHTLLTHEHYCSKPLGHQGLLPTT
jgi:hypothetical protein